MDDRTTAATTLGAYLPRWLELRSRWLEPASVKAYTYHLAKWAPLADRPLGELTLDEIQAVIDELVAGGLAPRTVRVVAIVLRTALADAVRNRIIDRDPSPGVRLPRVERTGRQLALSEGEAGAFMHAALEMAPGGAAWRHWYGPMLAVLIRVPMRGGEARGLLRREVQLRPGEGGVVHGIIQVRAQIPVNTTRFERKRPKSAASVRDLPIDGVVAEILEEHYRVVDAHARRRGTRGWAGLDLVFPGKHGGPAPIDAIRKAAATIAAQIGLAPSPSLHTLRHTYASHAADNGLDPRILAKLMGHESPQMTFTSYYDPTEEAYRRAVEASKRAPWDT